MLRLHSDSPNKQSHSVKADSSNHIVDTVVYFVQNMDSSPKPEKTDSLGIPMIDGRESGGLTIVIIKIKYMLYKCL